MLVERCVRRKPTSRGKNTAYKGAFAHGRGVLTALLCHCGKVLDIQGVFKMCTSASWFGLLTET